MHRHLADLDPARRRSVLAALVADGLVARGPDGYDLERGPRKVAP